MATVTKGYTFGATELVTNTKLHTLVDSATVTGIVAADITDLTLSTADIANDAVTYAKIQNVSATDKVLGRSSSGAGDVEEIACTSAARTILDDTTVQAILNTIIGTSEQGDILYFNGTNWVVLHHGTAGEALLTGGNGANPSWGAAGDSSTRGTFVNGDLSTGKLTITHNLSLSAPYSVIVVIFDNNYKQIIPDEVTGATNSVEIDLTSYGTLSGTGATPT